MSDGPDDFDLLVANLKNQTNGSREVSSSVKAPGLADESALEDQSELRIGENVRGARSDQELKTVLSENRSEKVLVTFGSTWCHSCHSVFPHLYRLTNQFTRLKYVVAQVDYMHDAAEGVEYTPTFRFVDKGRTVDQFYGADKQMLRDRMWLHND